MSKPDIKSAFRNIPVHPSDWELLSMKWKRLYYFGTILPFGLRSAPYLFDQFSRMLKSVSKTKLGTPYVIHVLDDFFLLPNLHGLTSSQLSVTSFVSLQSSISLSPRVKPSHSTTSLDLIGDLLDSNKIEARLPLDKLTRTKEALHYWSCKKSATLKEVQSLIDTLQFACRVVVPSRAFLQRIISLTKGISNPRWHIKLNTEFRRDVSIWLAFLEHWNGVTFFLGDTVLSSPDLQLLKLSFHMTGKSQTIGDFTFCRPSQILPIYRTFTRYCPTFSRDARFICDRGTGAQQFRNPFVGNDCRLWQKSVTRRENRNAPDSPDLSPLIPDDREYLQF